TRADGHPSQKTLRGTASFRSSRQHGLEARATGDVAVYAQQGRSLESVRAHIRILAIRIAEEF
ncbi:MAG TPA: hypothetical protein VK797_15935, partial [Tepidisphaeraceae bacterium]|nr:hypothetical protein [Tepidisphaeraceae bacterium]